MNTAALPWRAAHAPSLPEVHRSVAVPSAASGASNAKRALAFAGAGYLVAVGYMDPGNWATSIAGGSQFGYSLLAVILISNLMAMLFQAAAVRLGLASGRDLAQMCREQYPPAISFMSSTRRRSASCSGSCARSRSLPATSPKCSAWRSG